MPQTILRLDASARTQGSTSRAFADAVLAQHPSAHIIRRDLAKGIAPITEGYVTGTFKDPGGRTPDEREALALSDTLFAEINAADTLLIATATYNFNIPASLKAWIDQVTRRGLAFRYTETGPLGLLTGKRAVVLRASSGTPTGAEHDFATPYLTFALGFIGINDVTFLDVPAAPAAAEIAHAASALVSARAA